MTQAMRLWLAGIAIINRNEMDYDAQLASKRRSWRCIPLIVRFRNTPPSMACRCGWAILITDKR
jgi:hypothetical protein